MNELTVELQEENIKSKRHYLALQYALDQIKKSGLSQFIEKIYLYGSCARGEEEWDRAMKKLGIDEIRKRSFKIFDNEKFVKRVFLFGSYARGEEKDNSDLDFLVETNKEVGLEFFGLYDYLQDEFQKSVDVITEDEANRIIGNKIKKDKVLIYERI